MRILNDGKSISKRVQNRRDLDSATHVVDLFQNHGAEGNEFFKRRACVRHTPIGLRPIGSRHSVGNETQLKTADRKTDIERFVKLGFHSENLRIPRFGFIQIGCGIDHCPKSEQHKNHFQGRCKGIERR